MQHDSSRRTFIASILAALAPFPGTTKAATLCLSDPTVLSIATPLTIDTHAHFFNGRDLQIKSFLSKTTVGPDSEMYPLVNQMGAILQNLAWHLAPSAQDETRAIERYAELLKNCDGAEQMRKMAMPSFREGYAVGRRELRAAADVVYKSPLGASVLGPKVGKVGLGAAIADLPATYDEFEERRSDGATVLGSQPTFLGYLQFVLHNFNHRHVNAIDYLTTYSRQSERKIDLVVPSMVDYDWWLAHGKPTPTSLADQVEVMSKVSILLGGRVHGFAPFCPFREAMTSGSGSMGESLLLVKHAIETRGFIGVKLYPPMGFAPWGNTGKTVWQGKATLPSAAANPDFGGRLDAAMQSLFQYCIANDVPIMAHTNHSNGPYEEFKDLAGSKYWTSALQKFKGLRVSFGHFGDTDLEDHHAERPREFLKLITSAGGSNGVNTYADSSYFAGVLGNQKKIADILQQLYAASENQVLFERLMYGTDWTMILPQRHVERYLSDFIDVMHRIEADQPGIVTRKTTLSNAFFGQNAAQYLGLTAGKPNRQRLEHFYTANKVPEPDWMRKLG
ncbi:MAG: Amidohydrolase [Candidatus Nitrotoga sp. SPKER]|nr:MAG: Amidohydrolase [Candidatus Nitrotoga sp. SPKER]